jgi:SAM-dependent methyltransferase
VSQHDPPSHRFEPGVSSWIAGLGLVRDAVRQELVSRQRAAHLPPGTLRILDAGCGQGTQAFALARLGHEVTGVDLSVDLLDAAGRVATEEGDEVRRRVRFEVGDILALGDEHRHRYDVVCCHGVAMYLPSLVATALALAGAARPGGLISLLTRNRLGLAMRAGMTGKWTEAIGAFDARTYDNRLGITAVRADEPAEVHDALLSAGATTVAWYGVRLFTDHFGPVVPGPDFAELLAAEEEAARRDPYRQLAALTHTLARLR